MLDSNRRCRCASVTGHRLPKRSSFGRVKYIHALLSQGASEAGLRTASAESDRRRNPGARFSCRRRVLAKYAAGETLPGPDDSLGGSLLLPDSSAGRTRVLGAIL